MPSNTQAVQKDSLKLNYNTQEYFKKRNRNGLVVQPSNQTRHANRSASVPLCFVLNI